MGANIYESFYKDVESVVVENDKLKAHFLPKLGGKMASLVWKETGREFLSQAHNPKYKIPRYDGIYVDAECSGFDDMFPTIDVCYYETYPWNGVKLPDHGEVYSLCWSYKIEDSCLYMSTYGVRLPYKLEKWIRFETSNTLKIEYKATNLSHFDMDFIWAAHPMINAEEGGEIILPYDDEAGITCVFSEDGGFGKYGYHMKWPKTTRLDGKLQALNITAPRNNKGNNYKYYFNKRIPEGWCIYKYNSDGTALKLSFPEDKVPYFSIWVNEGSFHNLYNIAPEPCTGAFDRVDFAKIHGTNSVLEAKNEYCWFLSFSVTDGTGWK